MSFNPIVKKESEETILSNLKLVVIDCAYDTFSNPETQKFFGKYVAMKLEGFANGYAKGILPLGSYDFIATLFLICEIQGNELEPGLCFKISSLKQAERFKLPYELLGWFQSDAEKVHSEAVNLILDRIRSEGSDIGYGSSWTSTPKWRQCEIRSRIVKDLSIALVKLHHENKNIPESMLGAVQRFKVDKHMGALGFECLSHRGEPLPPVEAWFANREKAVLMHLKNYTEEGARMSEKYKKLWEDRFEIAITSEENTKIAA